MSLKIKISIAVMSIFIISALFLSNLLNSPIEQQILKGIYDQLIVVPYEEFNSELEKTIPQCEDFKLLNKYISLKQIHAEIELFDFGPFREHRLLREINFSPIREYKIEQYLQGEIGSLGDEGVTVKGLSNLQYALTLKDLPLEKKCNYLKFSIEDMKEKIDLALKDWKGDYRDQFIKNYSKSDKSIDMLVNVVLKSLNMLEEDYLAIPFGKKLAYDPRLESLPDHLTESSKTVFSIKLNSIYNLFFDDETHSPRISKLLTAELNQKLRSSFNTISNELNSIKSFEEAISTPNAVDTIYTEIKNLNILVSTEVVTQLGVTVTFTDNDGD
ncbi:MAG: hypothetical protein CL677_01665 [Bdellovibrionaceae bacterium]|nr:hypothetical protein [Pseudobdellovibrionaceae bacterium]|tara:strand:+ start:112385 stop:113371 length:987 start_codon:yes stop_codon:yes gene_type:complete